MSSQSTSLSTDNSLNSDSDMDEREWLQTLVKLRKKDPSIYAEKAALSKETKENVNSVMHMAAIQDFSFDDDNDIDGDFLRIKSRAEGPENVLHDSILRGSPIDESHDSKTMNNLLTEYFGAEDKLSDEDKFLRSYIARKGWVESKDLNAETITKSKDDENYEEEEEYEWKYNFRFEQNDAHSIHHARFAPETLRKVESKRKRLRERAIEKQDFMEDGAYNRVKLHGFKYTKVKADDFGMSLEEILTKDDNELNKAVSMNLLSPYYKRK